MTFAPSLDGTHGRLDASLLRTATLTIQAAVSAKVPGAGLAPGDADRGGGADARLAHGELGDAHARLLARDARLRLKLAPGGGGVTLAWARTEWSTARPPSRCSTTIPASEGPRTCPGVSRR